MADTKISALTSGNPAQSGDEIPIARAGANYKITAGSIASLAAPAGSDTYVQFNDGGAFGAEAGFAYNKTTNTLAVEKTALGTAGAATGVLTLSGSTSGTVTLQPAAAAGTYTLTLPTSDGNSGEVLTTDGSGVLSWAAGGGGGGTKTLAVFTPMDNQPPASNFATLDTRNSVALLDFDAATDEAAVFVGVINEAAVLTSGIKVTISWAATSATSGDCVWGVQFEKTTGQDIDFDSFDTATTGTTTTSGTSGVVNSTSITCTSIDSLAAGNCYRVKIYRDADSGSDTMTGDAELVAVELQQVA